MVKKSKKQTKPAKKSVSTSTTVRVVTVDETTEQKETKKIKKTLEAKKTNRQEKDKKERHLPKPLAVVLKPFFAVGRYFRDSWRELRQVRWTNRKATWKMTFAVVTYTVLFFILIGLLDALFTFIFNKVLG